MLTNLHTAPVGLPSVSAVGFVFLCLLPVSSLLLSLCQRICLSPSSFIRDRLEVSFKPGVKAVIISVLQRRAVGGKRVGHGQIMNQWRENAGLPPWVALYSRASKRVRPADLGVNNVRWSLLHPRQLSCVGF
jgi:hypothetical protein